MLQSLDFALIGVVTEKRQGVDFGRHFVKSLSFLGIIESISAVYQFKPKDLKLRVAGELGMTHLAFCVLIQLKDVEDWGQDFGRQIHKMAESVGLDLNVKTYEVKVLDFRSQFTMCNSVILPYPQWLKREEFLYPSLEILPKDYIHPVLNVSLQDFVNNDNTWENSAFLKTGKSLLGIEAGLD